MFRGKLSRKTESEDERLAKIDIRAQENMNGPEKAGGGRLCALPVKRYFTRSFAHDKDKMETDSPFQTRSPEKVKELSAECQGSLVSTHDVTRVGRNIKIPKRNASKTLSQEKNIFMDSRQTRRNSGTGGMQMSQNDADFIMEQKSISTVPLQTSSCSAVHSSCESTDGKRKRKATKGMYKNAVKKRTLGLRSGDDQAALQHSLEVSAFPQHEQNKSSTRKSDSLEVRPKEEQHGIIMDDGIISENVTKKTLELKKVAAFIASADDISLSPQANVSVLDGKFSGTDKPQNEVNKKVSSTRAAIEELSSLSASSGQGKALELPAVTAAVVRKPSLVSHRPVRYPRKPKLLTDPPCLGSEGQNVTSSVHPLVQDTHTTPPIHAKTQDSKKTLQRKSVHFAHSEENTKERGVVPEGSATAISAVELRVKALYRNSSTGRIPFTSTFQKQRYWLREEKKDDLSDGKNADIAGQQRRGRYRWKRRSARCVTIMPTIPEEGCTDNLETQQNCLQVEKENGCSPQCPKSTGKKIVPVFSEEDNGTDMPNRDSPSPFDFAMDHMKPQALHHETRHTKIMEVSDDSPTEVEQEPSCSMTRNINSPEASADITTAPLPGDMNDDETTATGSQKHVAVGKNPPPADREKRNPYSKQSPSRCKSFAPTAREGSVNSTNIDQSSAAMNTSDDLQKSDVVSQFQLLKGKPCRVTHIPSSHPYRTRLSDQINIGTKPVSQNLPSLLFDIANLSLNKSSAHPRMMTAPNNRRSASASAKPVLSSFVETMPAAIDGSTVYTSAGSLMEHLNTSPSPAVRIEGLIADPVMTDRSCLQSTFSDIVKSRTPSLIPHDGVSDTYASPLNLVDLAANAVLPAESEREAQDRSEETSGSSDSHDKNQSDVNKEPAESQRTPDMVTEIKDPSVIDCDNGKHRRVPGDQTSREYTNETNAGESQNQSGVNCQRGKGKGKKKKESEKKKKKESEKKKKKKGGEKDDKRKDTAMSEKEEKSDFEERIDHKTVDVSPGQTLSAGVLDKVDDGSSESMEFDKMCQDDGSMEKLPCAFNPDSRLELNSATNVHAGLSGERNVSSLHQDTHTSLRRGTDESEQTSAKEIKGKSETKLRKSADPLSFSVNADVSSDVDCMAKEEANIIEHVFYFETEEECQTRAICNVSRNRKGGRRKVKKGVLQCENSSPAMSSLMSNKDETFLREGNESNLLAGCNTEEKENIAPRNDANSTIPDFPQHDLRSTLPGEKPLIDISQKFTSLNPKANTTVAVHHCGEKETVQEVSLLPQRKMSHEADDVSADNPSSLQTEESAVRVTDSDELNTDFLQPAISSLLCCATSFLPAIEGKEESILMETSDDVERDIRTCSTEEGNGNQNMFNANSEEPLQSQVETDVPETYSVPFLRALDYTPIPDLSCTEDIDAFLSNLHENQECDYLSADQQLRLNDVCSFLISGEGGNDCDEVLPEGRLEQDTPNLECHFLNLNTAPCHDMCASMLSTFEENLDKVTADDHHRSGNPLDVTVAESDKLHGKRAEISPEKQLSAQDHRNKRPCVKLMNYSSSGYGEEGGPDSDSYPLDNADFNTKMQLGVDAFTSELEAAVASLEQDGNPCQSEPSQALQSDTKPTAKQPKRKREPAKRTRQSRRKKQQASKDTTTQSQVKKIQKRSEAGSASSGSPLASVIEFCGNLTCQVQNILPTLDRGASGASSQTQLALAPSSPKTADDARIAANIVETLRLTATHIHGFSTKPAKCPGTPPCDLYKKLKDKFRLLSGKDPDVRRIINMSARTFVSRKSFSYQGRRVSCPASSTSVKAKPGTAKPKSVIYQLSPPSQSTIPSSQSEHVYLYASVVSRDCSQLQEPGQYAEITVSEGMTDQSSNLAQITDVAKESSSHTNLENVIYVFPNMLQNPTPRDLQTTESQRPPSADVALASSGSQETQEHTVHYSFLEHDYSLPRQDTPHGSTPQNM